MPYFRAPFTINNGDTASASYLTSMVQVSGYASGASVLIGNAATSTSQSLTEITIGSNLGLSTSGVLSVSSAMAISSLTLTTALAIAQGGTGATGASQALTNLGAGTIATQSASSVAFTGGSVRVNEYECVQTTTTATLDFSVETEQTITLAGNTTFTTSNLVAGRHKLVKILCDGTNRVLAFPAGWTWVGIASPTSILANKTALVACISYGTTDSSVVAAYIAQL